MKLNQFFKFFRREKRTRKEIFYEKMQKDYDKIIKTVYLEKWNGEKHVTFTSDDIYMLGYSKYDSFKECRQELFDRLTEDGLNYKVHVYSDELTIKW